MCLPKIILIKSAQFLSKFGFVNIIYQSSVRKAGGFCLACKNSVEVELVSQNTNINALIFSEPPNNPWILSLVSAQSHFLRQSWASCQPSAGGLNGFIINNRLINLGFQSNRFTWTNKCPFGATIKERLDIAIANESWCCLFPNANLKHYPITGSDHAPIILCTMGETHIYPKPFRFESMWTRDLSSFAVIKGALIKRFHGSLTYCLSQKIREAEFLLKEWNKDVIGNICYKIKSITD